MLVGLVHSRSMGHPRRSIEADEIGPSGPAPSCSRGGGMVNPFSSCQDLNQRSESIRNGVTPAPARGKQVSRVRLAFLETFERA